MDELLEILEDIDPDNDYENDEHLIDDAHLDSLVAAAAGQRAGGHL